MASIVAEGAVVVSMTVSQVSMAAMAVSEAIAIIEVGVGFSIGSSFSFRGSLSLGVCSPLAIVVSSTVVGVGAAVVSMAVGQVTMTVSEAVSEAVAVVVMRVGLCLSSSSGLR